MSRSARKLTLNTENLEVYKRILAHLVGEEDSASSKANVVILYLLPLNARLFLQQASVYVETLQRNFTFIGVESWGDILGLVEPGMEAAKGSLSTITFSKQLRIFEHLTTVRPSANNRWLCEIWQQQFFASCNCSANSANCTHGDVILTSETAKYRQSSKISLIYDSVLAFATALDNIKKVFCPGQNPTVCPEMTDGAKIRAFLQNESFSCYSAAITGDKFGFDLNGDPLTAQYNIKNMIVHNTNSREGQTGNDIEFRQVGIFSTVPNLTSQECSQSKATPEKCFIRRIKLDENRKIIWNDGTAKSPISICSSPCPPGHERKLEASCAAGHAESVLGLSTHPTRVPSAENAPTIALRSQTRRVVNGCR